MADLDILSPEEIAAAELALDQQYGGAPAPGALDVDAMRRGAYGSRPAPAPAPAMAPYRAPADLGGFVDELVSGAPAPRPAGPPQPLAVAPPRSEPSLQSMAQQH